MDGSIKFNDKCIGHKIGLCCFYAGCVKDEHTCNHTTKDAVSSHGGGGGGGVVVKRKRERYNSI